MNDERPNRDRLHSSFIIHHSSFSLLEVMIVMSVMCVLIVISVPSFSRSIEQSHADIAGANLRAVWTAERLYWLEYRTYTDDLSELQSLGLLDPTITASATRYIYDVPSAATDTFSATATRTGSTRWSGAFTIDEDGMLSGTIHATGVPDIAPGFQ